MSDPAERLARRFHYWYERLAPLHGYQTRAESAVKWEKVPLRNRHLMTDVAAKILFERRSEKSGR